MLLLDTQAPAVMPPDGADLSSLACVALRPGEACCIVSRGLQALTVVMHGSIVKHLAKVIFQVDTQLMRCRVVKHAAPKTLPNNWLLWTSKTCPSVILSRMRAGKHTASHTYCWCCKIISSAMLTPPPPLAGLADPPPPLWPC